MPLWQNQRSTAAQTEQFMQRRAVIPIVIKWQIATNSIASGGEKKRKKNFFRWFFFDFPNPPRNVKLTHAASITRVEYDGLLFILIRGAVNVQLRIPARLSDKVGRNCCEKRTKQVAWFRFASALLSLQTLWFMDACLVTLPTQLMKH